MPTGRPFFWFGFLWARKENELALARGGRNSFIYWIPVSTVTRRFKNRKYKLLPGSELLRVGYWTQASRSQLKGLIKRFATRENAARKKAMPFLCWRRRRLRAVAVYEARFEQVPEVFRKHKLPPMKSYYVHNGRYVWPENGQPGKPVG